MPFRVIREDITKVEAQMIVCPTDEYFSHSGGADYLIHEAAGAELFEYLKQHGSLKAGDVLVSPSFEMANCKYIIHVHGPIFDPLNKEAGLLKLKASYEAIFEVVKERSVDSLALPLISSGAFGFPKKDAMNVALSAITDFLLDSEVDITLLVYDLESYVLSNKLFGAVDDYLKDHYQPVRNEPSRRTVLKNANRPQRREDVHEELYEQEMCCIEAMPMYAQEAVYPDIDDFVPDESFTECLVRLIREKDLSESDIWKGANLDRKTFNQIRNNKKANPKKETVLAICIGMKLDIDETRDLLEKAGYALGTSKFDWVMRFFIEHKYYNIMDINLYLAREDLKLLGSTSR